VPKTWLRREHESHRPIGDHATRGFTEDPALTEPDDRLAAVCAACSALSLALQLGFAREVPMRPSADLSSLRGRNLRTST
jgi:hypothetical protein